jgi:hypothetical protein
LHDGRHVVGTLLGFFPVDGRIRRTTHGRGCRKDGHSRRRWAATSRRRRQTHRVGIGRRRPLVASTRHARLRALIKVHVVVVDRSGRLTVIVVVGRGATLAHQQVVHDGATTGWVGWLVRVWRDCEETTRESIGRWIEGEGRGSIGASKVGVCAGSLRCGPQRWSSPTTS